MIRHSNSKEFDNKFKTELLSSLPQNHSIQEKYKNSHKNSTNCSGTHFTRTVHLDNKNNGISLGFNKYEPNRFFKTYDEYQNQNNINQLSERKLTYDGELQDDLFSFGIEDSENSPSKNKFQNKGFHEKKAIDMKMVVKYHNNNESFLNNTLDLDIYSESISCFDGNLQSVIISESEVNELNFQDAPFKVHQQSTGISPFKTIDAFISHGGNIYNSTSESIVQFEPSKAQNIIQNPIKLNTKYILNRDKVTSTFSINGKIPENQDFSFIKNDKEIEYSNYIPLTNRIIINNELLCRENSLNSREVVINKQNKFEDVQNPPQVPFSNREKISQFSTCNNLQFNENEFFKKLDTKQSFQASALNKIQVQNNLDITLNNENFENNQSNKFSEPEQIVILSSRVVSYENSCREKPFTPPRSKYEETISSKSYIENNVYTQKDNEQQYSTSKIQKQNNFQYYYKEILDLGEENRVNPTDSETFNKEQISYEPTYEYLPDYKPKINKAKQNSIQINLMSPQINYRNRSIFEIESILKKNHPVLSKSGERPKLIVPNVNQQKNNFLESKVVYLNQIGMNHNLKSTQLISSKSKTEEKVPLKQNSFLCNKNNSNVYNITNERFPTPNPSFINHKQSLLQSNQSQSTASLKNINQVKTLNPPIRDPKSGTISCNESKLDSARTPPNQMTTNNPTFYLRLDTLTNVVIPDEHTKDSQLFKKNVNQFSTPTKINDISNLRLKEQNNKKTNSPFSCATERNLNESHVPQHYHKKSSEIALKSKIDYLNEVKHNISILQKTPVKMKNENNIEHQFSAQNKSNGKYANLTMINKANTTTPQKGLFKTYRN